MKKVFHLNLIFFIVPLAYSFRPNILPFSEFSSFVDFLKRKPATPYQHWQIVQGKRLWGGLEGRANGWSHLERPARGGVGEATKTFSDAVVDEESLPCAQIGVFRILWDSTCNEIPWSTSSSSSPPYSSSFSVSSSSSFLYSTLPSFSLHLHSRHCTPDPLHLLPTSSSSV